MTTLRDPLVDFAFLAGGAREGEPGAAGGGSAMTLDRRRAADHVFSELYNAHGGRIHRFLRDLLGDGALASDATQETFVRAFRQKDTFDASRSVLPWLLGIARNVSLEIRRSRQRARRIVQEGEDVEEAVHPTTPCPERQLLGREALGIVSAAVERLSEERRAMLLLRLDHALSYEEIADLMNFSLSKVKVEIFRAREILRETMADYEREGAE